MKLLIVEDEELIREELKELLNRYGYETSCLEHFEYAAEEILRSDVDLVLMDISLPYKDGIYLCKEIRKQSHVPIIMLTAKNTVMDEIISLNTGADDFIAKPYHPQLLLAHIEAVIQRVVEIRDNDTKMVWKGLGFDYAKGIIYNAEDQEQNEELTKNEIRMLRLLMENSGTIVSRDEIMEELWQSGEFVDENTLNVNMVRLRKKINSIGVTDFIETKRGLGYRI